VDLGIDGLNWKYAREVEQRLDVSAINARTRALARNFDSCCLGRHIVRATEYGERRLALPYEPLAGPGPKRTAATEQKNGLEDGGLAGAIFAGDEIQLGRELQCRGFHAAQVLDTQLGEGHRASARLKKLGGDQSRIGITTYFALAAPVALTRQLLLPSVSPNTTFSESTAARASSR